MTSSFPRLFQAYWVVPGQLLAGEYPAHMEMPHAAARLDAILAAGISSFRDLTCPGELAAYLPLLERRGRSLGFAIDYQRFPIEDRGIPDVATMRIILRSIDAAIASGRPVYLHCWGGVGRTGMVVGCYLVQHGLTGRRALDLIADWWREDPRHEDSPRSPETPEQIEFVLNWAQADEPGH